MAARTGSERIAHVVEDDVAVKAVVNRLKRAQGQLGGAIAMLEDDRSCADVVTVLAAASKAVDRAAFQLIATSLRECVASGRDVDETTEQLQKLFLSLA